MDGLLPFLIVTSGFAAVLACCTALAVLARRKGSAGAAMSAAMAAHDEAFRATAHESHYELQARTDRRAPTPTPDGPPPRRRTECGTPTGLGSGHARNRDRPDRGGATGPARH